MSGLTFSLRTTTSSSSSLPSTSLNLLPLHLEYNGPAPVSTYFLPRDPVGAAVADTDTAAIAGPSKRFPPGLVASFRGRRLQAHTIPLPIGYTGLVISAPPIPTTQTEDVSHRQLPPSTLKTKRSQVTRVAEEDEGVAGLRRSPRKRKVANGLNEDDDEDDASVDEIKPSKRLQRVVKKKVIPLQKFSLDSDSEEEEHDTTMATTTTTTTTTPRDIEETTMVAQVQTNSVLQGTSLESVETIVDTIPTTTTTLSEIDIPSLSTMKPTSPTPQSPVLICDDASQTLRKLDGIATFSAFSLWTADGPMEGDGARDEYVRTLGEWVRLSEEMHGCC